MRFSATVLILAVSILATAGAVAAPVLDGQVQPAPVTDFYTTCIVDSPDVTGAPGLDISKLNFAFDDTYVYVGVSTTGPFNPSGSDQSIDGATTFTMGMYATNDSSMVRMFRVYMTSPTDVVGNLYTSKCSTAAPVWTTGQGDIAVAETTTGGGLEFRIPRNELGDLGTNFVVRAELDDNGGYTDDTISGQVPEPATMALLGLGVVGLVIRRRRHLGW